MCRNRMVGDMLKNTEKKRKRKNNKDSVLLDNLLNYGIND